ncbi:hypothetical protein [Alteromonas phage JH01]|nr:hypothetical protein [Alteromonas phage JH01]
MGNENVNAEAEKRLFADVQVIKQKQDHTDSSVSDLLTKFVEHSKTTNEHLSSLALSTQELVIESRTANKRIDDIEDVQSKHENDFRTLGKRVVDLEQFKLAYETEKRTAERHRKWWSDNWHKILMVFVISIPVIVAIYQLVQK